MYAEKQDLIMTDVVKSKLENDKCNKENFQTNQY